MRADKESTLVVARGLYVLRYESSLSDEAPLAYVAPAPGCERAVEIVSAPGAEAGRLGGPGEALVVRALEPVNLTLGVKRRSAQGSLEASLKLETLFAAASPVPQPAPPAATDQAALFVAHVARRGDVAVASGAWAGGPDAPARIEGLEVLPFTQDGAQLEIQTLSTGGEWSSWCGPGSFAGSRGRNLPLVGLRLRLNGPGARKHWLNADALFLGGPVVNRRGGELEFLSPTGADPLVGLRCEVRPERRLNGRMTRMTNPDGEPRVRVFKAAAG